ncbi:MAG TPA: acyl-CoA dehydrogenase [Actinomycetota bacterium]
MQPETASSPTEPSSRPRPPLDVAGLAVLLDGPHHELKQRVRKILARPSFAYRPELPRDEYRDVVYRLLKALAAEGLGLVGYPKEVGGEGNVAGGIAIFETVAFHDLSLLVKLGVQFGLFGGAVAQLGTADHHRTYLHDIGTVKLPGCFAMTETGHGSNVRDIQTTATYDPNSDGFVVHTPTEDARKDYIGNAAVHGRMAVVFAQLRVNDTDHGVHALLVPIRSARGQPARGVRIEDCGAKLGLNGVDNGRLSFDHVRVPRTALLNRFAAVSSDGSYSSPIDDQSKRFFTMLGALVAGRVSVAAGAVSASKSALAIAVRYGARRRQFGPGPGEAETVILDYLAHQRRLMPALATTYALGFAMHHLLGQYARAVTGKRVSSTQRRTVEGLAAGLKAMSTWHATQTIQTCREACGGAGYMAANRLAALKADTDVFTTFEGDNTVLLQLVAKGLLTEYREEFGDPNVINIARYLAARVVSTVTEAVPASPTEAVTSVLKFVPGIEADDARAIRDRDWQIATLQFRERHMLDALARRMKRLIDDGVDPFEAFVAVQDHAVATARAHVERLVLEYFDAAIGKVRKPGLAEVLNLLCDLYALDRIERDRGWFQEHRRLSANRSKAVVKRVNELCGDVRAVALDLVAAFAIPDRLLAAPIALS